MVQENLSESKVAMVYGQMNEPPGNRLRVALTGLTIAESFRDEGRDVLFFVDNIYRYTLAGTEVSALLGRICLPPWVTSRRWPKKWAVCKAYYLHQGGFHHLHPGRVRASGRLDRPVSCHHVRPLGLHRGAVP